MTSQPPLTSLPAPPETNSTFSPPAPPPSVSAVSAPAPGNLTSPPSSGTPTSGSTVGTRRPSPTRNGYLPPGALAGMVVGVVIGAGIVLAAVGIFLIFYKRRKRKLAAQNLPLKSIFSNVKNDPFAGKPHHWQQNVPAPSDYQELPKPSLPPSNGLTAPLPTVPVSAFNEPLSTSGSLDSDKPFPRQSPGMPVGNFKSTFTYEELKIATDNFSEANLLGQGGFGYVHKGVLTNGKVVAIKQLKAGSGQGEREFQAEIEIISQVHHRHLVSLVGYCTFGSQRLLVYEFVPNKTLEFHLHGKDRPVMNWPTRMKIALGSARGLAYLHEDCQPKIIHRDIKSANILLDDSFEAKVADFGLAKHSLDTDTHVSTRVMGTFGYLAPEYASSGKLTEKSDVFSFGVLLLELITGFRPFDKADTFADDSMVDWATPLLAQGLADGNFDALVDQKLEEYDSAEMARMAACAAACIRHSARRRPRMSQIVRALEGNTPLDDLNEGITPGHSTIYGSYGGSDYNSMQYREDMKKFRKIALESVELGSSDYSGLTSDYGQNPPSSSTEDRQATQETEPNKAEKDTNVINQSSSQCLTFSG
ncbi:proline-rich receptor-like protein kinase PERK1 [Citrus sinensis]|uniref:Proline-rich receptor-like protein kinase PERK1 n=1 Tax=Citrus sinensis TaxID=2711 RepID=A0ACB8J9C9_CITSI|nr:proline-rich receptor-like protein kinase PERK1 [Citrus sinensis]